MNSSTAGLVFFRYAANRGRNRTLPGPVLLPPVNQPDLVWFLSADAPILPLTSTLRPAIAQLAVGAGTDAAQSFVEVLNSLLTPAD